ncbi:MAG: sensor histidine kinase, partial [Gemmatimonadales bacterium]
LQLLGSGKREWEQTVDAIRQAICIVDAEGIIRRGNLAFANLTRVPVTALPGRSWLAVLPTEWTTPIGRALATAGGGAATAELRKDTRILTVTALTLAGAAGSAVLVFEDQTDTRRLQEQLIQSEKMSAIGQLIAGVAHELNNPLTSVVGFTDYLSESGDIPPTLAEPFSVIRQEAERAATIVRNLLGFARKQEGRRTLHRIEAILKSTLMLMRNQWMGQQLEVSLEVEPDLPAVEVDANQVQQVFVNLLNNAAQAIAAKGGGGHIVIRARRWLDGVAVAVVDDGPGVPETSAARVFEPFWTTKPEGQGTGLGLAVSQGIVREHGGRITHEPTPGGGATFTVELPSVPGATEPRAARDSGPH